VEAELKNEQIAIETFGCRLYSLFCANCGHFEQSESELLHEIQCSQCESIVFRVRRNPQMELLLMGKEGTKQ